MKTVIIVQARMTSTRLPGKVLKQVLNKTLLEYQIERLKRVKLADEIVIATTVNSADQPIVSLCDKLGVAYYRGSEDDVLSRYYEAAVQHNADVIVRVTSDCPLIDPDVSNQCIQYYLDNQSKYAYVSNIKKRTYPRGMDTEVFSFKSLREAYLEADEQPQREHVTPFIEMNPVRYPSADIEYPTDNSKYRLTIDTIEDYELIRKILESLYPNNPLFRLEDVLEILEKNPEWHLINAIIEQKKYGN